MQAFDYVRAGSIDEAVTLLGQDGARVLSGGTDLLVQMREGRRQASLLVDIKAIPEANVLAYDAAGLQIGAAVPCYRICRYPAALECYPGLVDAVSLIGGAQIQGRATVGGNLCNASPAADSIPALIVHQAECVIAGPNGYRTVPVEQFCTAPGQTVLKKGEFVVALHVPPPQDRFSARYLRFIPRNEMDIAVVGAGASVVLNEDGTSFKSVRIAIGAVAPTPLFVVEAGAALAGREVTAEIIEEAAQMARAAARPISDVRGTAEQRRHLSAVLTRRALTGAVDRAQRARGKE